MFLVSRTFLDIGENFPYSHHQKNVESRQKLNDLYVTFE